VNSFGGAMVLVAFKDGNAAGHVRVWRFTSDLVSDDLLFHRVNWRFDSPEDGVSVGVVPHALPALLALFFATTPWMKWRFSLRTLLIVMTVVALLLGLAAMS
jgi:hypothetical protein